MQQAELNSKRATCCRKQVGAVLVNIRGEVLSSGYNGTPRGVDNCTNTEPCNTQAMDSNTTSFAGCIAVHAEQNALMQCPNVHEIEACYTTLSPCLQCIKMLMNTSCNVIYFREAYHSCFDALQLWQLSGKLAYIVEDGVANLVNCWDYKG